MRAWMVALFLLALALAGCLGGNDAVEDEDDGNVGPTEETGVLFGEVQLSSNFEPVGGARVRLVQDEEVFHQTNTSAEGQYRITGIAPGVYLAQVTTFSTQPAVERVTMEAQREITLSFLLDPLDNVTDRTPRSTGPHDFKGFFSCTAATLDTNNPVSPCSGLDDNHKITTQAAASAGLRTLTIALDWDPSLAGAEQMTLRVSNIVGSRYDYAVESGPPPVEVTLRASEQENVDEKRQFKFYDDGERVLGLEFAARPAEPGLIYNQAFDIYWTFHYWEEAEDGFSTLPDG